MKSVIRLMPIIGLLICSCEYKKFVEGVHADAEQSIIAHKYFFKTLSFSGKVYQKKYCSFCTDNKYQIVLNISHKNPSVVNIENFMYQPYYFFNEKDQLTIVVKKEIYDSLKVNDSVKKQSNSYYMVVENNNYQLINYDKKRWLPE